jgi:hypothetical protein
MLLEPWMVRAAGVVTKDKETLGTAVNILFSTDPEGLFGDAYIVVFPNTANPIIKGIIESGVEIAKTSIDKIAPGVEVTIKKGIDEGQSLAEIYQDSKEKKKLSMFYLVPLSQVTEAEAAKKLLLNVNFDAVKDCVYADTSSIAEKNMVFYRAAAPDEGRLWNNTLNFTPIQSFIVIDSSGIKGKVESLVLDSQQSVVTALTVRAVGTAAGKYNVALADFDFKTMRCAKPFDQ